MLQYIRSYLPLRSDRRAVTAIEYGLIAALIAVAIIGGVRLVGQDVSKAFANVDTELNAT